MKTVTRTVLVADEGMILTDGNHYGTDVILKVGGNAEEWREITKEEYELAIAESEAEVV
ncbi:MAG: hypothetical protein IJA60_02565 [Clostridia bacterium]|nr:hypothetical protein [Clostridia bacterium]